MAVYFEFIGGQYMKKIISIIVALIFMVPVSAGAAEQANSSPAPQKEQERKTADPAKQQATPPAGTAQDQPDIGIIKKGEKLTLKKCVEIALRQQPTMLASLYTVEAFQSRIGQAQSGYFPQVNVSAGYNRIKPLSTTSSGGPSLVSNPKAYDYYTGTAGVTQLIYDFGKTPTQVNIAKLNFDASRSDLDATRATTIQTVKQAYYGLLKAKRNVDVAKETVTQYEQHLEQSKGFYEVGTKPKYDVTTAEVNLSNSKLNLITAVNSLKIARVTLNNAIGLPEAPDYDIEDSMGVPKKDITLVQAIDTSLQNRPEILATGRRVRSAEENIALARTGYYPTISGTANYNLASYNEASFNRDGWNAGISISIPIFSGFLTHYQVKDAEATYNAAKANFDLLKQNVILEVQQAYLNLVAAADKIPTSELAQRQAAENLEIANGRYAAGVGNPIEVTDAQVTYTNAKTTYIQALYDYNVALANLDKSMGLK
jgi:outer membrane protein